MGLDMEIFVIDEDLHCVWEYGLKSKSLDFLEYIDLD